MWSQQQGYDAGTPRSRGRRLWTALALALVAIGILSLNAAPASAIAGGYAPDPNAWPWVTALIDPTLPGTTDLDRRVCTAVLIAPDRVLTAAHCVVEADNRTPRPASRFQALVGRRSLLNTSQGVRRNVTGVAVHPGLSLPTSGIHQFHAFRDLAVLFLDSPVTITPAPLGTVSDFAAQGTVMGWGHTNVDHQHPVYGPDLMAADLPLLNDPECAAWFNDTGEHYVKEIHVCANNAPGSNVACITHGDSGGPLMVLIQGAWRLIGITSFYSHIPDRCGVGGPFGFAWVAGPELRSWPFTVANPGPGAGGGAGGGSPAGGGGVGPPAAALNLGITRLQVQRYALAMVRKHTNGPVRRFSKSCSPIASAGFKCSLRWRIGRFGFAGTAVFRHVVRSGKVVPSQVFRGVRRTVGCRSCRATRVRW